MTLRERYLYLRKFLKMERSKTGLRTVSYAGRPMFSFGFCKFFSPRGEVVRVVHVPYGRESKRGYDIVCLGPILVVRY